MRTYLANIDWNNWLKNKAATECWTYLKYEIEGIIMKFVPLIKHGKRSRKKHLSKEDLEKKFTNRCCGGYINTLEM